MAKSNLPQGQISFTTDNDLVVHYPKNTLKKRIFAHHRKIKITLLVLFLMAYYFGFQYIPTFLLTLLLLIYFQKSQLKKLIIENVTLLPSGLKYKYYDIKTPETIQLEDSSHIDIKVKLLEDSTVELDLYDFLIYFDDIEKLPLVIDNIATTWNMAYYDTIHINEKQEVLTYASKAISNFKGKIRLKFEDKPTSIIFRDDLAIQKYFSVNKQTGEVFSHKFSKGFKFSQLNPFSIRIAAYSNLGFFYKESEIRISLVNENDGLNTIFISERRHKDEVVTTYRDVELIYDTLNALPVLEDIVIEKQFH